MGYVGFDIRVRIKSKIAIVLSLILVLAMVAGTFWLGSQSVRRSFDFVQKNHDMIADVAIAEIAHMKAGQPVTPDIDYSLDKIEMIWGMETNSEWLANYTNLIIPMLVYEKIGPGYYPKAVVLVPYVGAASQHISGSTYPMFGTVIVNERHVLDSFWRDERDTLTTLVHELIHVQGGAFIMGSSERLESATSAATVEALAGMCNFGDQLACKAFWLDVEFTARNDLRARLAMMHRDDIYRRIAGILWMNKIEENYTEKKSRYWDENYEQFVEVLAKYNFSPWRNIIIPGILDKDKRLNTMIGSEAGGRTMVVGMPYDDSSKLLGWIVKELMRIVISQ